MSIPNIPSIPGLLQAPPLERYDGTPVIALDETTNHTLDVSRINSIVVAPCNGTTLPVVHNTRDMNAGERIYICGYPERGPAMAFKCPGRCAGPCQYVYPQDWRRQLAANTARFVAANQRRR